MGFTSSPARRYGKPRAGVRSRRRCSWNRSIGKGFSERAGEGENTGNRGAVLRISAPARPAGKPALFPAVWKVTKFNSRLRFSTPSAGSPGYASSFSRFIRYFLILL